jgi:hypothetical protein
MRNYEDDEDFEADDESGGRRARRRRGDRSDAMLSAFGGSAMGGTAGAVEASEVRRGKLQRIN